MDNSEKKPKFEIQPIIEQKPFENPAVQSFFTKWCEINDSIEPQFVSREEWEQKRVRGMLQKRSDGKQTLFIPKDLQLWEMIGVMEAVDHDTFAERPERQDAANKRLLELGKTFQDAGIYIAQRLDSIKSGQEIARPLAIELYNYGQWLVDGTNAEGRDGDIPSRPLTVQETDTVDRFLAGDTLYESRQTRAEKRVATEPDRKDELYEEERRVTLAQFFRASAKAFELAKKSESGALRENKDRLRPWRSDTPLHNAFLAKVERALSQKIETPKRELHASIFRRGMDLLQKNMPFDTLPDSTKNAILHWQDGEKTLRDALQIDRLKAELETVRKTGDTIQISSKEREIADKIQKAVSNFQYKTDANNPSEMVANQYLNCVGASTLGGALLHEAGLTYLVGDVPQHSLLFLVTEDGHIQWQDMLNSWSNENVTNQMID